MLPCRIKGSAAPFVCPLNNVLVFACEYYNEFERTRLTKVTTLIIIYYSNLFKMMTFFLTYFVVSYSFQRVYVVIKKLMNFICSDTHLNDKNTNCCQIHMKRNISYAKLVTVESVK